MKVFKNIKASLVLLLCFILVFNAPLTVLAGDQESEAGYIENNIGEKDTEESQTEESDSSVFDVATDTESATVSENETSDSASDIVENSDVPSATNEITNPIDSTEVSESIYTSESTDATDSTLIPESDESPSREDSSELSDVYIETTQQESNTENPVAEDNSTDNNSAQDNLSEDELSVLGGSTPSKVVNNTYVDAEKYSTVESGYDSQLCWAATAANMLWTAGYGENAVNPSTGVNFQNEDEIMDYYRTCFDDNQGVPSEGINYFANNTYAYTNVEGVSQLKDTAYEGGLVEGGIDSDALSLCSLNDSPLSSISDLTNSSAGILLHWYDTSSKAYLSGAHWLTLVDLETDSSSNCTGVVLANSDNDPCVSSSSDIDLNITDEEKAQAAANATNSYTHYSLSKLSDTNYWIVDNYYDSTITSTIYAVITHFCTLKFLESGESNAAASNSASDNSSNKDINAPESNDNHISEDEQYEQYIDKVFKDLKSMMVEKNILTYSPTGNVYDKSSDDAYTIVVRKLSTDLLNVYVDGKLISISSGYYAITMRSDGMFTITFNKDLLNTMESGNHTITMEFSDKSLNSTIEIK